MGLSSLAGATLTWLLVRDDPARGGAPLDARARGQGAGTRATPGRWWEGLARVARNRATWPGFFVNLGLGGTFLAFAGLWAVPYLVGAHGLSRGEATLHSTVMLLAFAVSALAIGKLSDRLGRRKPLMLALAAVYAACWVALVLALALPGPARLALFALMGALRERVHALAGRASRR